ncbi:MAG: sensor histidine kinase [Pseudomonadota bacterium]
MALILAPLILIACLLGYWRYTTALATAEDLFDRYLLAATLAISRDVAVSEGDALSITTRDLITEATGGQVFYHVAGPDRAYLTGYAYPPVPPSGSGQAEGAPLFYESLYRGTPVRALMLVEQAEVGPFLGLSAVTTWQSRAERHAFAQQQALRSAALLGSLLLAVAGIIWFGVNRGLRPLLDLEDAIAARNPEDLGGIRRPVPQEVRGIVSTLNGLFGQVRDALQARDVFLSNAAHQLRNPVAGMLAMAEAADGAASDAERAERLMELKSAARRTARLTNQMLALERIKGRTADTRARLDLNSVAREVATRNADLVLTADVAFEFHPAPETAQITGDALMLEEVLENLIDNALRHGGPELSRIDVSVATDTDGTTLRVADDGRGIPPEARATALERFGQVRESSGTGLGLAIVQEVAAWHGAELKIEDADQGTSVALTFAKAV